MQPVKFKRMRTSWLAKKARAQSKKLRRDGSQVSGPKPVITHGWPRGAQAAEFKAIDVATDSAVNAGGALVLLNGCTRGSDIANRIGRQIVVKSIQFNISNYSADATGIDQTHRVLLVYDKQSNGVTPAVTDILTASTCWAMRNLNNRNRFIILYDNVMAVKGDDPAQWTSGNVRIHETRYYRRHNLKVQFNAGDAGTVADMATGALYMILIGSVAAGATAGNSIGNCRVRFIDS